MSGAVPAVLTRVPVPDLGPSPGTYERGWLGQALLVVAIIAVGYVVAVVVTREKRVARGGSLWGPFVVAVLAMVVPLGIVYVMDRVGEAKRTEALEAYVAEENAVQDATKAELEEAFGIVYEDAYPFIPVQRGEHSRESMTLPDGSVQECFTVAGADGYYAIRCGGERPDEGVELEPATS